ncbi:BamA/TamA family outer membrane protein [Gemmatimonas groenlandica]|uniref:BamA/TamA family outer membrane protein n=1 Tax=Gemmatimonas groenlandica TaxID=2732249 RepID=A0A6M4IJ72_9BACT|nr:BamA/TamA family outer membrane protein [Gemmatimonas groenlandica]QJR34105.1 BamA/TamA family outer membrane protein [Gemmatimonas groenlandica]
MTAGNRSVLRCSSLRVARSVIRSISFGEALGVALGVVLSLAGAPTSTRAQSVSDSTVGRRRIQPLPALGSAPETGLQYGATVLAVFDAPAQDHARPASLIATALRSTKSQTRISVEGEHWSRQNARRLNALVAWQKFPLPFYGIGDATAEGDKEIFTPKGIEAIAGIQQRVRGSWYATGGIRLLDQSITADTIGVLRRGTLTGSDGGRLVELSVGALLDSRDNLFAPRRGTFAHVTYTHNDDDLGSPFQYDRVRLDARHYRTLTGTHVVAAQLLVLGVTGDAPFDQLALVGGGDIMRGYSRGRYRDQRMAAAQVEYRTPLVHRLGLVAFAGAGTVASKWDALTDARLLPTYGGGVRVQIDPQQRTAVRLDYGLGRDSSSGLYIGFNQAF